MTPGASARPGDLILLVGTRKGSFIITGDAGRRQWEIGALHNPGAEVFHMCYDGRAGGRVLAAANSEIWGPQLQYSDDLGVTWVSAPGQPRFSKESGATVKRLWHVEPGPPSEPGVLYAGVDPAALFKSEDGGANWQEVTGLSRHPTRPQWEPGFGGLCLHSIVVDPRTSGRMWVGISTAGVFGTGDGGATWQPMNQGVRADFAPEPFPEWGQCPHKVLSPRSRPELLYQQNHCGVFRSDSGSAWQDVSEGLPSRFGFVLGLHPRDPDTIYVVPEDEALGTEVGGWLRFVTGARLRVYRSRNGGGDWEALTRGLPQTNAYLHLLREALATDSLDPCGIYLGTTSGQIFYSRDEGDSWELLVEYLPPVNSLSCARVVR